ncbi:maleylpyruvate isomerase family mycothiol-dependent enzyme [Nocardioides litoris]|uniref:maleylpyruvate isomerase family mycothiol-dependent enzyme n=1 Tax=Nocardioides litoris TaxID=1926648 RepID=UPI00111E62A3|nr:maleylpyruvate isomerase family mycothiol-dependent enzyme [Nocardioides litoris]
MTLLDRVIGSLRHHHDLLAELVGTLDEQALAAPSGSTEWQVHDVLSHLGSGAEIMLGPVAAAAAHTEPEPAANEAVWERWNATDPAGQATAFVEHDARLVEALEGLDGEQRETLPVDLGSLPAPVPLVVAAGMRLNEVALHTWDVLVAFEPGAPLDADAAEVLLELYTGPLSMLLHWGGKADRLEERTVVALEGHGLAIDEDVSLVAEPPVAPTATFTGPVEAAVRLFGGRLPAAYTPEEVAVHGNVTLEQLRDVFPGY